MSMTLKITDEAVICALSKATMAQIKQWQQETDEKEFIAQIAEDSEFSRTIPHIAEKMRLRYKKDGIKKPYYGAAGGAYVTEFGFKDSRPFIRSVNDATKEFFEIMSDDEPLKAADKNDMLTYKLSQEEMGKFSAWRQTAEGQGKPEDYLFTFYSSSLGGGIVIRNVRTSAELNTINYDDW